MTGVIGCDIEGHPLKAGDKVMVVGLVVDTSVNGTILTVVGLDSEFDDCFIVEEYFQRVLAFSNALKLHNPTNESFESMLDKLTEGVPA